VFGREKNEPDLVLEQRRAHRVDPRSRTSKWARERAQRDREAFRKAAERDTRQKEHRVQIRPTERFKLGDWVLIPRVNRKKTQSRWQGPYEVVQVREGGTYRLRNVKKFRDRQLRHHRLLRPYVRREDSNEPDQAALASQRTKPAEPTQTEVAPRTEGAVFAGGGEIADGDDHSEPDSEASVFTAQSEDNMEDAESQLAEEDELESHQLAPAQEQNSAPATMDLSDTRKKGSLERRPVDIDEEGPLVTRRSQRRNFGVPPKKYIVDSIQSTLARVERIAARIGNWSRSHNPMKQMALSLISRRDVIPGVGGEECGDPINIFRSS
jgi:hypothetical protein